MIRLFAALSIPPEVGQMLAQRQHGLPGARWRPLESLHITLRFFGEVSERVAEDLDLELERVAGAPLILALAGVGAFDEAGDVHAVWAGVEADANLAQLARRCERAARQAGLTPERRAWRPHLTLAYLRRGEAARVASWMQANALLRSPAFRAEAFGLYSSWPGGEGTSYRLERSYPLRGG
ncbi:MAG TPA: RNA 2',3'-cyclic phosphodiesterase, partial [Caulobacteraceae bacterium]|nr:RNA 2',3'-cyclic phosphodiesterase [Caulobacteraceae bacterium]